MESINRKVRSSFYSLDLVVFKIRGPINRPVIRVNKVEIGLNNKDYI